MPARTRATLVVASATLALAGCGGSDGGGDAAQTPQVISSFYPLQFVAERVAGDLATVSSLTAPGVEPHDLELTPRAVASVGEADLVLYLKGFQPAVDEAVQQQAAGSAVLEVGTVAGLDLAGHEDDPGRDPHFWLDPTKLAAVAEAVGDALADADDEHAQTFRDNASALVEELTLLDADLRAGLSTCVNRTLVVSHEAFGYLAARYDLEQVGVAGLSPDDEPSPAQIADLASLVRDRGVRTVYHETLASPEIAETIAAEAGVQTSVLDPIEGLTDDSAGSDYLEVMRANLTSLQSGQPCP